MLFTGWEVRTGKISSRGLRSGLRPKAEGRFWDRGKIFFSTDRPKRWITFLYFFLPNTQKFQFGNRLWDQLVCYVILMFIHASMAEKQLKRCDKTTLFSVQLMFVYPIRQWKGKIITIIYFLVCFAKGTWLKCGFIQWVLYSKFYLRFAKNSVFDNI